MATSSRNNCSKRYGGVSVFYVATVVVVTVVLLTLPYFGHNQQDSRTQIESAPSQLRPLYDGEESIPEEHEAVSLAETLAQASMADPFPNTVIITCLNAAWSSPQPAMLDLVLSSFRSGEGTEPLLRHLVIVCTDQKAFERCVEVHAHCFRLTTTMTTKKETNTKMTDAAAAAAADHVEGEKEFMSGEFVDMMWRRVQFLGEVLELGYNFIFSDGDILWFRNPLSVFSPTSSIDLQISTDRFRYRPFDLRSNVPNTGFSYTRSNNRTVALYRRWYQEGLRRNSGKKETETISKNEKDAEENATTVKQMMNDQHVLTALFREEPAWVRDAGIQVQFFDTVYFSGFCQVSRDMSKVVTMHSNCCIGLRNKLHDLHMALEDWSVYRNTTMLEQAYGSKRRQLYKISQSEKIMASAVKMSFALSVFITS